MPRLPRPRLFGGWQLWPLSCCPWILCGRGLGVAITPGDIQCMPGHVVKLDHFAETEKTKPFLKPWLMACFLKTRTEIDGFHLSVSRSE